MLGYKPRSVQCLRQHDSGNFNRQPQQLESRLQISKKSPVWQLEPTAR